MFQGICFLSFCNPDSAAWCVIEGPRYVKGQNLEAKWGFNAFAGSDSHTARFVDR